MRARTLLVALVCAARMPTVARAQDLSTTLTAPFLDKSELSGARDSVRSWIPWRVSPRAQRFAPLASAVVPGAGQMMLGHDRFVAYLAVEALSWWRYTKDVREQRRQETEFKTLARRVARAPFTLQSPDLLPDADWAYYEKMRDYAESGSFSLATSGPIVPDTDVTTYNGSRWQLARTTFSTREAALQEYVRTAVTPEFEWSWKDAVLQYDRFKRTTDKRNDAYRGGIADLMVIGTNHILSMIDAFSTIRLRAVPSAGGAAVGATVRW
jgi:hypothetical protein